MSTSPTNETGFNLRDRYLDLTQEIASFLVDPPERGENERVSGTVDPRRLPASATLLELSRWLDHIADQIATGNVSLDDLTRTLIPTEEDVTVVEDGALVLRPRTVLRPLSDYDALLALVYLARRAVEWTAFPEGTPEEVQRLCIRTEVMSDLGDEGDVYVDAILRYAEEQVEAWLRGSRTREEAGR